MVSFEMNDRKKIGLGLTGFGVFFSFLGIIFLFDKGLIAIGNILFLSGVTLTIGLKSSMQFFMKPSNFKGTVSFGLGFILVIIGWPIIGMIIEAYGFVVLFSGFWPTLAVFLQKIPVLGWLLQQPFVRSAEKIYDARLDFRCKMLCVAAVALFLIAIVEKEYLYSKFYEKKC
ncbi:Vesicle transport protein GOT1 [Sesamum alatum]|uniref:Vesicle transport protein GOT1 n=1 Tax=Sesamum alatum TaxID=300844 RepID=A0AAE1Z300_9LAMI|nr:Vesicle transport protein GOT1 [Sesamum alatum]